MSYIPLISQQSDNTNVIVSNQWSPDLGYKLFDNNLNSFWTTNLYNNTNQYCGIKLDNPAIAKRVGIVPRQWNNVMQIHDFKLQASNDGITWIDVLTDTIPNDYTLAGTWIYFDFDNNTAYDYYRLFVINANTSQTITVFEMQLYAEDAPPPPGFQIVLQINQSESNRLDKSLTTIATLTGVLKNETSIINPVILFEGDLQSYVNCNYMQIPIFGRCYFVSNIRSIRSNLFEISAHVDVLSTYKDSIRSNNAIIRRQESTWNLYLNDGVFRVYQNPMVLTREFPSGFNTQEFVLAVAGS